MDRKGPDVEIRPIQREDLPLLEEFSGPPGKHRYRLALQGQGEAIYLVAWQGDRPLGHALVIWAGTTDEPMARCLHECPVLEDLYVHPDYRSRKIGSLLLARAEEETRGMGYSRIGLGVGVENPRAHQLYLRRGYRDSGCGEYPHLVHYDDARGNHRTRTEICIHLVKDLA